MDKPDTSPIDEVIRMLADIEAACRRPLADIPDEELGPFALYSRELDRQFPDLPPIASRPRPQRGRPKLTVVK